MVKKVGCPKNSLIVNFHDFCPISMKLGGNDYVMSQSFTESWTKIVNFLAYLKWIKEIIFGKRIQNLVIVHLTAGSSATQKPNCRQ